MSPIDVGTGVERMVQHAVEGSEMGTPPLQLATIRTIVGTDAQANSLLQQVSEDCANRTQFREFLENQSQHGLDLFVRIQSDPS